MQYSFPLRFLQIVVLFNLLWYNYLYLNFQLAIIRKRVRILTIVLGKKILHYELMIDTKKILQLDKSNRSWTFTSLWPWCLSICFCRSHQSVATLSALSSHSMLGNWHSNCRWLVDGGGGTPRPELLTGAKKFQLGCLMSFHLPMGFQNFIEMSIKIHPF